MGSWQCSYPELPASEIILLMQVGIGEGRVGEILVLQGDTPSALASEFCRQFGVERDRILSVALTQQIQQCAMGLQPGSRRGGRAVSLSETVSTECGVLAHRFGPKPQNVTREGPIVDCGGCCPAGVDNGTFLLPFYLCAACLGPLCG
mmetsp:Transcript_69571/g.115592  ORF Transcript_69571/g.115592 Transcript_69571/m.115592 type:complete len:148 (-) Transcript_69571:74-517(-)